MWSLQVWGEVVDASKAKIWNLPTDDETDQEQTGSDPGATEPSQKPKPTDHLPDDHGSAEGEAHKPGLAEPTTEGEDITSPSDVNADEGFFSGIETLRKHSTWVGGAAGFIVLCGFGAGAFFLVRSRRKKNLFGLSQGGERGSYRPVSEDLPMGLLDRSRQKLMGGGRSSGNTKDVYDAFAYEASEEEEDDGLGEAEQLRYTDQFLEDEDDEEVDGKERYTDVDGANAGATAKVGETGEKDARSPEGSSSGSSSWQDAAAPSNVPSPK